MEKQSYYGYYTTTPSFSTKEKRALHDLFGRDFFRKGKTVASDKCSESTAELLSVASVCVKIMCVLETLVRRSHRITRGHYNPIMYTQF